MNWLQNIEAPLTAPTRVAFWITLAGLGYTLTMISAREVTPELHILEAVLFTCLFGVVFMVPWLMSVGKTGLKTPQPTVVITRGMPAYFVSGFYFLAATLVPVADMVSITFTRPIFGTIAAILLLHEVAHARR